ncbi:MAG: SAM-dependent methyltransferase, partial [Puniceicoccales bacterium]
HQDLTCNVCWDRVAAVLERNGFAVDGPQRQEAFFMEKSAAAIRQIVEGGVSAEAAAKRSRLMQLINPVHFGAAFQVLWGIR